MPLSKTTGRLQRGRKRGSRMMEEWMRVGGGEGKNRGEHERLMSSEGEERMGSKM